jgi:hypothetical protein
MEYILSYWYIRTEVVVVIWYKIVLNLHNGDGHKFDLLTLGSYFDKLYSTAQVFGNCISALLLTPTGNSLWLMSLLGIYEIVSLQGTKV